MPRSQLRVSLLPFLVSIAVLIGAASDCVRAQDSPCTLGTWEAPFDQGGPAVAPPACSNPPIGFASGPLNAIHSNLITKGAHRGHVMVFGLVTSYGSNY
jgi:hypothetical protein